MGSVLHQLEAAKEAGRKLLAVLIDPDMGGDPAVLMVDRRTVAEGAHTAPVLRDLAARHAVDMPIVTAVCALLGGAPARDAVAALLTRPLRAESGAGA